MLGTAVKPQETRARRIRLGRKALVRHTSLVLWLIEGFKSVFAVADKVAIYSNGYNFVLDRTKRLGTVCPIVESEFLSEEYKDDDDTIVELFLALEDTEKTQLRQRFLDLEPEMLLFLRRLRRVEIKFQNQQMLAHECDKLGRVASIATDKPSGRSFEKYHLSDMVWTNLPANEKRESGETRTTLAFPFSDSGPVIKHQKLYAFLPLQNTCFFVSAPYVQAVDLVPRTRRFPYSGQPRGSSGESMEHDARFRDSQAFRSCFEHLEV